MSSEIRRLMEVIDAEYKAYYLGLNGYAQMASHEAIERKMVKTIPATVRLSELVGHRPVNRLIDDIKKKYS